MLTRPYAEARMADSAPADQVRALLDAGLIADETATRLWITLTAQVSQLVVRPVSI